jgi:hypothetical protein
MEMTVRTMVEAAPPFEPPANGNDGKPYRHR